MKIEHIDSCHPDFRGCRHNLVILAFEAEGETEKALLMALQGATVETNIYAPNKLWVTFKPRR